MTIADPDDIDRLVDALGELILAEDPSTAALVFEAHPALLDPGFISVLKDAAAAATESDPDAASLLSSHVRLLEIAKAKGGSGLPAFETEAWRRRGASGELVDPDVALAVCRDALADAELDSEQRASAHAVVGEALLVRSLQTGSQPDLEEAVENARRAVAISRPESATRADALTTLGWALDQRHALTGWAADLHESVSAFEAALAFPRGAATRVRATAGLASVLLSRFEREGYLGDLERAVELLRSVIAVTPADSPQRPQHLTSLAGALIVHHGAFGLLQSLDEAIAALEAAVSIAPAASRVSTEALTRLGDALRRRYETDHDPESLNLAVAVLERAVAEAPTGANVLFTFATALVQQSLSTNSIEGMDRAITALERAAELAPPNSLGLRRTLFTLAETLAALHGMRGDTATMARASEAFRAAIAAEPDAAAQTRVAAQWARWAERSDASSVMEAHERAVEAVGRVHVRPLPAGIEDVPTEAAFVFAEHGMTESAALVLEHAATAVRNLQGPVTNFEDLVAAAADDTLAYIVTTRHGGLVLTVGPGNSGGVGALTLPELTSERLRRQLIPYIGTQRTPAKFNPNRRQAFDDLGLWLWETLMGPLLEQVGPGPRLALIPIGMLGLVPLHAACRQDAAAATGRRYVLDDALVRYAPSAHALLEARVRGRAAKTHEDIMVIADPTGDLPGAAREAAEIAASFPSAAVLSGHAASRAAVLSSLGGHAVLHLACHGTVEERPEDSAIFLADGETLTPTDLASRLDGTRLVVLSASELGLPPAAPFSASSAWPGTLLAGGAAGVIAPLWSIEDVDSAHLMARFYTLWRERVADPAEALRQAQIWLREMIPDGDRAGTPGGEAPPADARPATWAAFSYFGA